MKRVLVTGFEPYGTTPTNPAQLTAEHIDGWTTGEHSVVGRVAPSLWFRCIDSVVAAIDEVAPEVVIMMGEYPGRAMLTVERIAQNLNDSARYGVADNEGLVLEDEWTVPGGPTAVYATLPIRAMVLAMRQAGVPADISDTPGTLMCNHLMYGVLQHVQERGSAVRVGWMHLPALPEVAAEDDNLGMPSMSVETATAGLQVAIEAAIANPTDIHTAVHSRLQI
jgi:pyroglutamyl-peptidase